MNEPDFLTRAFQESRATIPDAGFSARLERRIRSERRRRKIIRVLPVAMALLGFVCAAMFTSFSAIRFVPDFPDIVGPISTAVRQVAPELALLSKFGLQPWMLVTAIGAIAWSLFASQRDQRADFRF